MIASVRGLAIAGALVVVMTILVAVGGSDRAQPRDRAIVPGLETDAVTALAWPDATPVRVVRDPRSSTGWRWEHPAGEAEGRAVDDVLAALRGARWQREAAATAAGSITGRLAIERGPIAITIAIGQPLAGSEQQWIVAGDRALLVDAWVARALVPDPVALRLHAPLAGAVGTTGELAIVPGVVLRGTPRRLVGIPGTTELVVNPQLVDTLERALAELTIVAIPRAAPATAPEVSISLDGTLVVRELGACDIAPDRARVIDGPRVGLGCVDDAKWRAVVAAVRALSIGDDPTLRDLARVVDKRPAGIEPVRVTLADGAVLDLAKHPKIGADDADVRAVAELLAVLATPAEPAPLPTTRTIGSLEVAALSARIVLDLYPGGVVARRGEPVALRVGDGSAAILARARGGYRERDLWVEEPTTVRSIAIDKTRFTRGAVVGEWVVGTAPVRDGATVERLVAALATLHTLGDASPPASPRTVELDVAPPVGAAVRHTAAIGRVRGGCAATVDGLHVLVDPQVCVLVEQLAAR